MSVVIRAEAERDRSAVYALNVAAFGGLQEARLADALRAQARPCVSLVAEENAVVVGHIMLTPVSLPVHSGLYMGLAPMAVLPARQRAGLGSALVRAGIERCRRLDAAAVFVLGHPGFYRRFGFVPAARFAIGCEYDVPEDAFMALELRAGALASVSGTVGYHAAFRDVEAGSSP